MAKALQKEGLDYLLSKFADGTMVVGKAKVADKANSVDAANINGVIPLSKIPKGAIEELKVVANDTARKALTQDQVQNGDTVKVTSTGKMYFVVDDTKLSTDEGWEEYSVGRAMSANEADHVSKALKTQTGKTFNGSEEVTINEVSGVVLGSTQYRVEDNGEIKLPAYPTSLPASNTTNEYDSSGTAPVSGQAVKKAIDGLSGSIVLGGQPRMETGEPAATDSILVAIGKVWGMASEANEPITTAEIDTAIKMAMGT